MRGRGWIGDFGHRVLNIIHFLIEIHLVSAFRLANLLSITFFMGLH